MAETDTDECRVRDADQVATDPETRARERLPGPVYDYYAGGSDGETTLREAASAWHRWRLRPHMLTGVHAPTLATTLLDSPVGSPIGVSPWALQRMAHPDGELATAAGCAQTGTLMTVSTTATVALHEVAAVSPDSPKWFQLYRVHSPAFTDDLVRRAADSGYRALVVTVDLPVLGRRLRDLANNFELPVGLAMANQPDADYLETHADANRFTGAGSGASVRRLDEVLNADEAIPTWTYADIEHFAGLTAMPVVVKGVLRGDDAERSLDAGAAAIWVSTHGGRQLDRAVSSANALGDVVSAVGGQVEVYVDGGIRSGTDVLIALALGARAAFVGRPIIWGLTNGGVDGVAQTLSDVKSELAHCMTLCGLKSVEAVPRDLLAG